MPKLYHGTRRQFAIAMSDTPSRGTIDVLTRGSGEFGKGFYTQDSISNAHRWAHGRFPNDEAILILDIDNDEYHALKIRRLSHQQATRLTSRLSPVTKGTYTTADDVIVGPLLSGPQIEQQKFQTAVAQDLLNGPNTQRTVQ